MWRLGEQAEEAFSSAWNNKMIVFSATLIDHIPHWAICLLKGHPGPGKVERREPRGSGHLQTKPAFQGAVVWQQGQGWEGSSGRAVGLRGRLTLLRPVSTHCGLSPGPREVHVGHRSYGKGKSE